MIYGLMGEILKHTFPRLFNLSSQKNCKISEMGCGLIIVGFESLVGVGTCQLGTKMHLML